MLLPLLALSLLLLVSPLTFVLEATGFPRCFTRQLRENQETLLQYEAHANHNAEFRVFLIVNDKVVLNTTRRHYTSKKGGLEGNSSPEDKKNIHASTRVATLCFSLKNDERSLTRDTVSFFLQGIDLVGEPTEHNINQDVHFVLEKMKSTITNMHKQLTEI